MTLTYAVADPGDDPQRLLVCHFLPTGNEVAAKVMFLHRSDSIHRGGGGGLYPQGSVRASMVTCGRYASYWNAFLLNLQFTILDT